MKNIRFKRIKRGITLFGKDMIRINHFIYILFFLYIDK